MSRIYLASSWRNTYQPEVVAMLRAAGHEVYDFRNPPNGIPGFAWSEIDPDWQAWKASDYRDLLTTHPIAARGYMNDFRGMEWADTCVLLLPCGRSAHLEGGWFSGRGKRLIIWTHDGEEPELMALMANHIVTSSEELLNALGGVPPVTASVQSAACTDRTPGIRIQRARKNASIFRLTSPTAIAICAGTTIDIDGKSHAFEVETPVASGVMIGGTDYGVAIDDNGRPFIAALSANPLSGSWIGGFHFAPGGNATERSGGDTTPSINPYSLWDRDFRPTCHDPRGMTLVELNGRRFWVDIYLTGVDHKEDGTSRYGVEIADGGSLDLLDFKTTSQICADHGKRLLTHDEFCAAAFGVTENSSADDDPEETGLDAARTSKVGLMQATGNLWVWGTDGDPTEPRPSIFGGSWLNGSGAGSRYAHLDYWADDSGGNLGCRAGSDHMQPA